jgi:hypothetical protein
MAQGRVFLRDRKRIITDDRLYCDLTHHFEMDHFADTEDRTFLRDAGGDDNLVVYRGNCSRKAHSLKSS